MLAEKRVLITDTSMRDAHQSLLATRFRTHDMAVIAPYYASLLPQLFSVECWGGATFDVAMRFLKEDPWERLARFREAMPNLLLQMLLRSANAVGYTNYPDNVVRYFVEQAARGRHRRVPGVRLPQLGRQHEGGDRSGRSGRSRLLRGGDLLHRQPLESAGDANTTFGTTSSIAKAVESAWARTCIAIKDMARAVPAARGRRLVKALKDEIGMPVHFHTHDTSGIGAASVLAAVEAGARRGRRRDRRHVRAHLAAELGLDRRGP